MLLIGEKLNSSIPNTLAIFEPFDEGRVRDMIRRQKCAGAAVLDVNTALCEDERAVMRRVCALIAEEGGLVPMFDSPDEEVLCAMLAAWEGDCFLNSVTRTERRGKLLPAVARANRENRTVGVVALPVGDSVPASEEERDGAVEDLVQGLCAAGVPEACVYVDILVQALSTDALAAQKALHTLKTLHARFPGVKSICGLSNISFGLPMRARLNAAFAQTLAANGLAAAILDVQNEDMRLSLAAQKALCGADDFCMEYITLYRELAQ